MKFQKQYRLILLGPIFGLIVVTVVMLGWTYYASRRSVGETQDAPAVESTPAASPSRPKPTAILSNTATSTYGAPPSPTALATAAFTETPVPQASLTPMNTAAPLVTATQVYVTSTVTPSVANTKVPPAETSPTALPPTAPSKPESTSTPTVTPTHTQSPPIATPSPSATATVAQASPTATATLQSPVTPSPSATATSAATATATRYPIGPIIPAPTTVAESTPAVPTVIDIPKVRVCAKNAQTAKCPYEQLLLDTWFAQGTLSISGSIFRNSGDEQLNEDVLLFVDGTQIFVSYDKAGSSQVEPFGPLLLRVEEGNHHILIRHGDEGEHPSSPGSVSVEMALEHRPSGP